MVLCWVPANICQWAESSPSSFVGSLAESSPCSGRLAHSTHGIMDPTHVLTHPTPPLIGWLCWLHSLCLTHIVHSHSSSGNVCFWWFISCSLAGKQTDLFGLSQSAVLLLLSGRSSGQVPNAKLSTIVNISIKTASIQVHGFYADVHTLPTGVHGFILNSASYFRSVDC